MKIIKSLLYVTFLSCLTVCIHAAKPAKLQKLNPKDIKNYQISLTLPVNVTLPQGKRINMAVEVPREYVHVGDKFEGPVNEFIPKDERIEDWSEMITTHAFVGKGIPAQHMVDEIKKGIMSQASDVKVIHHSHKNHGTYSIAELAIKYSFKGRTEVMEVHYASGPYDCSGVQYTIASRRHVKIPRPADLMTEHQALEKIKKFMKENVQIITF